MELESENKELQERLARECRGEGIQESIDWLYMNNQISDTALDILNKKNKELKEENEELKAHIMDNIPNQTQYKYERELSQRMATLEEENDKLNKEIKEWRANFQEERQENKELKERNKYDKFKCANCKAHHTGCADPTCDSCVKELNAEILANVDYDGHKIDILETEVNNAMEYIDEAIERYSSPNPMVHKSTMLADFAELKKLLMN